MNVKRTCLAAIIETRLKALAKYTDLWQSSLRTTTAFTLLTDEEISEHFVMAPSPVFRANDKIYIVKTHFGPGGAYEDEVLNGNAWRLKLRQEMIDHIKRYEIRLRGILGCADARYWVRSVALSESALIYQDGRRYHDVIWRAALVKPAGWQPRQPAQ